MNPVIKRHMHIIHEEIKKAQDNIYTQTGVQLMLSPRIYVGTVEDKIRVLYEQMCHQWGVTLEQVSEKSREGNIPYYKKILWMAAKFKYPNASLIIIGHHTNIKDHGTVLVGIRSGYNLLETQDSRFLKLYEPVKEFFNVKSE